MKKRRFLLKIKIIVFFITMFICFRAFTQNYDVDSLQQFINSSKEDTLKINSQLILSKTYLADFNYLKEVKIILDSALKLSQKLNFEKGIGYSYLYYGHYYWRKVDYPSAIEYLSKSLTVFEKINNKTGIALANMGVGYIYYLEGKYEKAIPLLLLSAKLQEELKDKIAMFLVYNNIGLVYSSKGKYPEAMTFFLKALKLKEEAKDKVGMYKTLNNIGLLYEQQEKMDIALNYYLKALVLEDQVKDKLSAAITRNNIGRIFCNLKLYAASLKHHLIALQLTKETGDKQEQGTSYTNLGIVYIEQNRYQDALFNQLKALKITEEVNDKEGFIITCEAIGNTYEKVKNYEKAAEYYTKSLGAAKEINYKEGIKNSYKSLSKIYTKTRNYEKALDCTNLYYAEKDSILNKEVLNQIAELNTKYETEKKIKEIQLLTKDQELNEKKMHEQRIVRLALIIGLALVIILLFSVYKRYRDKKRANQFLKKQKQEIEKQNTLITDSIDFAKSIQEALLPSDLTIKKLLPESFIFFKPKDIVSGDFYWVKEKNNKIVCIVADCTGHGVPGAFMSLLGINMLDNITNRIIPEPANILTLLNEEIINILSQQNTLINTLTHGMDIAILIIDKTNMKAQYAGAHNSLYQVRNNNFMEIKADKMAVGTNTKNQRFFTNHVFDINKGDVFYLFTDGFADQMGGVDKKKFFYAPFKELLLKIHSLSMNEQKTILDDTITEWMGERKQMDDILIMGIKI